MASQTLRRGADTAWFSRVPAPEGSHDLGRLTGHSGHRKSRPMASFPSDSGSGRGENSTMGDFFGWCRVRVPDQSGESGDPSRPGHSAQAEGQLKVASLPLTWPTDGLVSAVPSAKSRVGTVRFPLLARATSAAPSA